MTKYFDHLGYNKDLKEIARKLRNDSTPAEIRQKELEDYGFTILRFWDDEIFNDLENVSGVIEHWIDIHPPAPPSKGELRPTVKRGFNCK